MIDYLMVSTVYVSLAFYAFGVGAYLAMVFA